MQLIKRRVTRIMTCLDLRNEHIESVSLLSFGFVEHEKLMFLCYQLDKLLG